MDNVQIYEERKENGQWLKSIELNNTNRQQMCKKISEIDYCTCFVNFDIIRLKAEE